ncbi:MAG TPA: alpha/beta hydrolase [Chloroflexota bacterium]|nr:alpha/beta hydrolase [Chloroflexota bacterium]
MDAALRAETDEALDRLLPCFGVPVARRIVETPRGRLHLLLAGEGRAVVLLHGGFGGAGNWFRTLGPLARRFQVLAPDRPGFGLAAPATADALAWLDDLLAALAVRRVALVGHAGGGALALAYARARPDAVTALALSDVPLAPPAAVVGDPAANAEGDRAASPGLARRGGARPRRVETWYASLAARFDDRRLLPPEYLYYLWCLARLRPDQDQRPPGDVAPGPVVIPGPGARTWPTVPTLLLWGRGNRWTSAALARQLRERIPDAELRVIDHSKGIPALEQPGEFNYAVLNFLAAHRHADE